jgi:hypothetical protein
MSAKARKRHTRKRRRLEKARRPGKRIVRHRCLKGRTGTAHSKTTKPRTVPSYLHAVAGSMESARLHSLKERLTVDMVAWT